MARGVLAILAVACLAAACATPSAQAPPPGAPLRLEDTHWSLVGLGPERGPIATTQTEAFLVFGTSPRRVTGSGGCNRLAGAYEVDGRSLEIGALASTRMACAHGMGVEDALGRALAATATFRVEGSRLDLGDATGAVLATFEARPAH